MAKKMTYESKKILLEVVNKLDNLGCPSDYDMEDTIHCIMDETVDRDTVVGCMKCWTITLENEIKLEDEIKKEGEK